MNVEIKRSDLLKPLSDIGGIVERRQTLPILSNVHIALDDTGMVLTGTDLEVEIICRIPEAKGGPKEITVAARKLLDICRALPEEATLTFNLDGDRVKIQSGRSRFSLQTLPAEDFPRIEADSWKHEFSVSPTKLKKLFEKTAFSMAQQDVRYYLNGLLIELNGKTLCAVATDGHRLAKTEIDLEYPVSSDHQIIVPRKAVQELIRLLEEGDQEVKVQISENHLRITTQATIFTTKLIDGRYPDYEKVIPTELPIDLNLNKQNLREILTRAAILTNEKFRGVSLTIGEGQLAVTAHNPEQEEAKDEMSIDYTGPSAEVGFNVSYILEAINALAGNEVRVKLKDQNTSCILGSDEDKKTLYLVMPMRI
ncbi:MAG: DNA polymerase III subunit beta [Gammaproteobacteria bacterium]|nr:DNA polymerase III subunit beta [Gammaproteobacteria bacterium]